MTIRALLAPTEHQLAKRLGDLALTSTLPEERGADILIISKHGALGIQRKEVPHDFISSMTDGRMAREVALLIQSCQYTRLLCEGKFKYYPDTTLVLDKHAPSRFKRSHVRGMLLDISMVQGIQVDWSDDLEDTIDYIKATIRFMSAEKHLGLFSRPNVKGQWIVPDADEIQLWLLQSFPGIGPAVADKIVKQFNGVPLRWTCTLEELEAIPRLSKARARAMYAVLHGEESSTAGLSIQERLALLKRG